MQKPNHELTEAEWTIIRVVWEHEPCAAPTVQEALEGTKKWAYSTVKTMMERMEKKGFLRTEKIRNLILYRSAITKSQAQKGEVARTLKRAFDGALTPMMQFMIQNEKMSETDLREMALLIKKRRKDEATENAAREMKKEKAK